MNFKMKLNFITSVAKQIIVNFFGKIGVNYFVTIFIIKFKLYFLLPHDIDFYAMLLFKKYIKNKNIVDVGGHLGLASLSIRYLNFKKNYIHIFEPNNDNFKMIKKLWIKI